MKTAIVHPGSILGKALQERLQQSPVLNVDALLTTREEEVGTLSESDDAAALTQLLTGSEADIYFVCGNPEEQQSVADTVQHGVVVHVEPVANAANDYTVAGAAVAGNQEADPLRLYCPSPVATALSHLLLPLAGLDLFASVVVLRGASSSSGAALDELLEQTRALLSFSGEMPTQTLPTQLAFNAVGVGSADQLEREVGALLPATPMSIRMLDVGIFHGVGLVIDLQSRATDDQPDLVAAVSERLRDSTYVTMRPADELLGTRDASDSDGILLSELQPRVYGVGMWAVFDNLTLAARNAVDVGEALGAGRSVN